MLYCERTLIHRVIAEHSTCTALLRKYEVVQIECSEESPNTIEHTTYTVFCAKNFIVYVVCSIAIVANGHALQEESCGDGNRNT